MDTDQLNASEEENVPAFVRITIADDGYKIESNAPSPLWKGMLLECAAKIKEQL
jgi:hypothetical protein